MFKTSQTSLSLERIEDLSAVEHPPVDLTLQNPHRQIGQICHPALSQRSETFSLADPNPDRTDRQIQKKLKSGNCPRFCSVLSMKARNIGDGIGFDRFLIRLDRSLH
jgi:hypothetical protein